MFKKLLNLLKTLIHIETVLDRIQQKVENTMATLQNFKDLLAAVDAETNRIAAKIEELVGQIGGGGLNETEEAEALAGLTAVAERLKTIGASSTNPVPPVEEPPVEI
jgi:predicted Ser/Thr protein kinase